MPSAVEIRLTKQLFSDAIAVPFLRKGVIVRFLSRAADAVDGVRNFGSGRHRCCAARQQCSRIGEWLFELPAFYAEFVALPRHSPWVDHLYVLRDHGTLWGGSLFASCYTEICFAFFEAAAAHTPAPRLAVVQPTFGHRKRQRSFYGWMFGIRCEPTSCRSWGKNQAAFLACSERLARIIHTGPSSTEIVQPLDRLLDDLTGGVEEVEINRFSKVRQLYQPSQMNTRVAEVAATFGRSARTLQRAIKASTGLYRSSSSPPNGSSMRCTRWRAK